MSQALVPSAISCCPTVLSCFSSCCPAVLWLRWQTLRAPLGLFFSLQEMFMDLAASALECHGRRNNFQRCVFSFLITAHGSYCTVRRLWLDNSTVFSAGFLFLKDMLICLDLVGLPLNKTDLIFGGGSCGPWLLSLYNPVLLFFLHGAFSFLCGGSFIKHMVSKLEPLCLTVLVCGGVCINL